MPPASMGRTLRARPIGDQRGQRSGIARKVLTAQNVSNGARRGTTVRRRRAAAAIGTVDHASSTVLKRSRQPLASGKSISMQHLEWYIDPVARKMDQVKTGA